MAQPLPPYSPGSVPSPPGGEEDPAPTGFEHLGWAPGWRDHLEALVARTGPGRLAGAAAGALAVLGIVAVVALRGPAPPPPELTLPVAGGAGDPAVTSTTTTTSIAAPVGDVVVHAAGAVAQPGVYRLPVGARVTDVLAAAGGATPEADLDRLNLAALLADGERVFVPRPGEEAPAVAGRGGVRSDGGPGATATPPPLDLNAATVDDLDTLPGVGPATAQAILAERERRGRFAAVEDLLDVRGIGEAKLEALRDLVRV